MSLMNTLKDFLKISRMSTRRVLSKLGLMKSPLTTSKTMTPVEKNLIKKINRKKEGILQLKGLESYEGRNLSHAIQPMEQKLEKMENQLRNLRGDNKIKYITNPGYMGGRKTRKQRRRRLTRQRR